MKNVNVVAAVIVDNITAPARIYATARGYGEFNGMWEFPGGKLENNETSRQALFREIKEELNTEISIGNLITTVEYDYPNFHLSMDCFWAEVEKGKLELNEALEARWLTKDMLNSVEWLPADIMVVEKIKQVIV